jgi:hypothetical protein
MSMEKIKPIETLLEEYRMRKKRKPYPRKIHFRGMDGYDVYNPTAPFIYKEKTYMAARVERRDSENARAVFFRENPDGSYSVDETMPVYELQDPFYTKISRWHIFGGTEIFPDEKNPGHLQWRTAIYYGESLEKMALLLKGPTGMKDIRLVELADGSIGVFTRPQGKRGGRGKIGFTTVPSLLDISLDVIEHAILLELFDPMEWGGCNEPVLLPDGKVGVLGHVARFTQGTNRQYYPMTFILDPKTLTCSRYQIIAERSDFLPGPAKREDLKDVLFSAGLIRKGGITTLYTGVSDAEVQAKEIDDPFK